jgi:O-antigen ligase
MEATMRRPSLLYRPMGIALTILTIAILWAVFPGNPTTLVLLAVGVIFLFGLKKPVWALAALLVAQFTITSYMVEIPFLTISLRLLLLLLIGIGFLILRSRGKNQIDLGERAKRVITPALILMGLSVVSNLIYSGFDFAFQDFRNMLVGMLIIFFLPAVTRSLKDLKILCAVVFIGVTASAVIAIMQHYQIFGMGQHTIIPGFLAKWGGEQARVPGMAETELELSYILSLIVLVLLGIFLTRGVKNGNRWLLGISLVPLVLAIYFTYTRSAIFALPLGLVALFLFLRTRIRGEILLTVILVGIVFIEVTGVLDSQFLGGRSEAGQQESTVSRQILWQAGIAIAMDNPVLGIGGNQYPVVAPRYIGSVDPALLAWEEVRYGGGYSTLGGEMVHNDFLYMWVSYGLFALILYLWLYFAMLRNLLQSYHKSSIRFVKGLAVGLAAGLIAYAANAFYHNCLVTIPIFWILAGLSVATAKIALKTSSSAKIPEVSTVDSAPKSEGK